MSTQPLLVWVGLCVVENHSIVSGIISRPQRVYAIRTHILA
ncbi:MAG: hypothetical protein ACFFCE_03890 [Promethearchaeota archaeon]